ncbi:hypothetical protein A2Y99_02055 [Candidatus Gottesmanbacteria bacterium RBG_13_37_7]|uniref:Uncharacterized protein n=1 Tax=Candidatus Gottesmanbacteria bacterium RBG_13_37_7 TaxID=1798369 RepID=A0A1F5YIN8_9BACT|nr:MAG: hypothetical protein A2Y99_02055 [Candidatus Gottesmanbacteria bacterium RBG_13_37_7]
MIPKINLWGNKPVVGLGVGVLVPPNVGVGVLVPPGEGVGVSGDGEVVGWLLIGVGVGVDRGLAGLDLQLVRLAAKKITKNIQNRFSIIDDI